MLISCNSISWPGTKGSSFTSVTLKRGSLCHACFQRCTFYPLAKMQRSKLWPWMRSTQRTDQASWCEGESPTEPIPKLDSTCCIHTGCIGKCFSKSKLQEEILSSFKAFFSLLSVTPKSKHQMAKCPDPDFLLDHSNIRQEVLVVTLRRLWRL